jgi:hypothetical protein
MNPHRVLPLIAGSVLLAAGVLSAGLGWLDRHAERLWR